jgi:simple sugar transport system permease protein
MKRLGSTFKFLGKIEGLPTALVLVLLYIAFMRTAPDVFLKYRIYMSFLQTVAPPLILGLGLTFVITAGEIDLSFPAVVAFSGFTFAWGYKNLSEGFTINILDLTDITVNLSANQAAWVAILLALLAGAFIGFINGIMIAKFGVPSIMATLGAQFFWDGMTVLLAGGLSGKLEGFYEYVPGQKGPADNIVHKLFVGRIYGIIPDQGRGHIGVPPQALWALLLAVILWFIMNRHKFGEAIMFLGDNPNVARVMGVNVDATKIKLFTMMGVIGAIAGLIVTFQVRVFFPTQGSGMLLPVMAAVFIGGTLFSGGKGSIVGTFFGSYIIGSLEAGVVASGINGFWVGLVVGSVIWTVVLLNIAISEGNLRTLTDRFRHWTVPRYEAPPPYVNTEQDAPSE